MQLISTKNLFRSILTGVAIAVVASAPASRAASILVNEDDGGGNGTVMGNISGSNVLTSSGTLTTYNGGAGNFVPAAITFSSTTTLVDIGGILSGTGEKILSDGSNTITFDFSVLYNVAGDYSNIQPKTITVIGAITSVVGTSGLTLSDGNNIYDFSPFLNVGSTLSLTWTKSTTGFNFNNIINHNATQGSTGAGLQQDAAAVPEPTSVGMLGLGLIATLGLSRLRRRKLA